MRSRRLLCKAIFFCFMLSACAAQPDGQNEPSVKVGMHIDASLGFAVEYPLNWEKTRRVPRGSQDGFVRWERPDGQPSESILSIHSDVAKKEEIFFQGRVDRFEQEHPDFKMTSRKEFAFDSGKAMRVLGHSSQYDFEIYVITSPPRIFTLVFKTPIGQTETYNKTIASIVSSFLILDQDDGTTRDHR